MSSYSSNEFYSNCGSLSLRKWICWVAITWEILVMISITLWLAFIGDKWDGNWANETKFKTISWIIMAEVNSNKLFTKLDITRTYNKLLMQRTKSIPKNEDNKTHKFHWKLWYRTINWLRTKQNQNTRGIRHMKIELWVLCEPGK